MTNYKEPTPPRLARHPLEWRCPENQFEELEGDLAELFQHWVREEGPEQARLSYWFHVLGLAGLGALAVTLLTVSYQAIRAATRNPVRSLRSE